jgi:hypothetical protein
MQDPSVREKQKQTNMKRRGVEYSLHDPTVKEKARQTNLERRGVENSSQDPNVIEKRKKTSLERFGTECSLQNKEVMEKTRQTKIKKYRVPHHSQSEEIAQKILKSSYRKKRYVFPNGREDLVQGYEPLALDILVKKYSYDDIITGPSNVPEIWYEFEEQKKRYFTDIYIQSENLCIEVKSPYTYSYSKERNDAKRQGAIDSGYNFVFWIFDRNGKLIEEKK